MEEGHLAQLPGIQGRLPGEEDMSGLNMGRKGVRRARGEAFQGEVPAVPPNT